MVENEPSPQTPDPAILRLALERFGLRAQEAVFVDDNAANVAAAAGVGMTALHFVDAQTLRKDFFDLGCWSEPCWLVSGRYRAWKHPKDMAAS